MWDRGRLFLAKRAKRADEGLRVINHDMSWGHSALSSSSQIGYSDTIPRLGRLRGDANMASGGLLRRKDCARDVRFDIWNTKNSW